MKLKVMSFNIQHGRDYHYKAEDRINLALMAETIKAINPDIVGLQEVRGEGESPFYTEQAKEIASLIGYNYYFGKSCIIKNCGEYGNALLTKHPIINAEVISIPDSSEVRHEPRSVLKAHLDINGGISVLVSHFGLTPDEARSASVTIVDLLGSVSEPKILMGDFNVTPENSSLDPIRLTMVDTADFFDEPKASFPSDNPTKKIDYIFVSDEFKVLDADIPEIVASDHRPYVAVLEV